MRQSNSNQRKNSDSNVFSLALDPNKRIEKENKMTAMMVTTVIIFVICNSFQSLYFVLWSQGVFEKEKELANKLWSTTHFLMTLNCSTVFTINIIFCEQFRMIFLDLFSTNQMDRGQIAKTSKVDSGFESSPKRQDFSSKNPKTQNGKRKVNKYVFSPA